MSSSEDFNVQNFQSLIKNYEAALRGVTGELDSVQEDQIAIKNALSENKQLSCELNKIQAEKSQTVAYTFKERDLIDNLKLQLKTVTDEKDSALKLWQNASSTVEHLENELRIYQDNTQGLVPKHKLSELKNCYEGKLNELTVTVAQTKAKLEDTINLKSKELLSKDKEISGTLESQSNTFKIIRNLEEEVLNLQERLNNANEDRHQLEKDVKYKIEESESFKTKVKECKSKVEEALQLVEAALNEKDAALLREAEAKEETEKISQTLNEFIDETDRKVKVITRDHDEKLIQMRSALQTCEELVKVKEMEVENCTKRCIWLEMEFEKLRNGKIYESDSPTSKILSLEKNLETTFQKLLVSEKQNIQLKSEMDSLKNDLQQMSHYYERDVNTREAENTTLKNEIRKLKADLNESYLKMSQSEEAINSLNTTISKMEINFSEQIQETKSSFQQTCVEREHIEAVHNQMVHQLQEQLTSQTEINKKWRYETKNITEQLEKIIKELKIGNSKVKQENKMLTEKLKEANLKMLDYHKFLEMISRDVTKITTITLPDFNEWAGDN